jgi:hypothetical protein
MAFPVFAPGDVLNASDMNAVGLWLIKTQTIGTTVSSVTVSDVFSADYENYRIIVSGGAGSTNLSLNLALGATVTGYYRGGVGFTYAGAASNGGAANAANWFVVYSTANGHMGEIDLFGPNRAARTYLQSRTASLRTDGDSFFSAGYLNDATQYTAFTLTTSTGTITGGEIRVYGYRN